MNRVYVVSLATWLYLYVSQIGKNMVYGET